MPTLEKYLTPNTDYFVSLVAQSKGKFIFCTEVKGWQKNNNDKYLIPFDLVTVKVKRDETVQQALARLCEEEIGDPITEITNMKQGQTAIMTDLTFIFETIEGEKSPPAYIVISKKATSSKVNSEAYSNTFVYSGKTDAGDLKSANMQALFKIPPVLLKKIMAGNYTIGEGIKEGMEVIDPKVQIPEDSVFEPRIDVSEFMRFLKESVR